MKTVILCLAALTVAVAAEAQSVFDGSWELEVLGSPNAIPITCDGSLFHLQSKETVFDQKVTIDEAKKTISIPVFTALCDLFTYRVNDDGTIDLIAAADLNSGVIDSFRKPMVEMESINSVSRDAARILAARIEEAFYQVPLLRFVPRSE
ncbi:hypothetical protein [Salinispira pacifica]